MAGSYLHIVNEPSGSLADNETVAGMLDNGGDVYEAVEEMYGMIWYLADRLADEFDLGELQHRRDLVEVARQNYRAGLAVSP